LREVLKSNDKDKNYRISAKELVNALNDSKVFEVKFDREEEVVISQAFQRKYRRSEAIVKEIQNMIQSSKLI
jgi:predicted DCC family thiol-disulfide oxidoreductase YuxK